MNKIRKFLKNKKIKPDFIHQMRWHTWGFFSSSILINWQISNSYLELLVSDGFDSAKETDEHRR